MGKHLFDTMVWFANLDFAWYYMFKHTKKSYLISYYDLILKIDNFYFAYQHDAYVCTKLNPRSFVTQKLVKNNLPPMV